MSDSYSALGPRSGGLAALIVALAIAPLAIAARIITDPDFSPRLTMENSAGPEVRIGRVTEGLIVKLVYQSNSPGIDTQTVTLRCLQSRDLLQLNAVETSPGIYASIVVLKNERPMAVDGTLNCRDRDIIQAVFVDKVDQTVTNAETIIDEPIETRIRIQATLNDTAHPGVIHEGIQNYFFVKLDAYGMNVDITDTILVTMVSESGERETFRAVETGLHTQDFSAIIPFGFGTTSVIQGNGILEGRISLIDSVNRSTFTAAVSVQELEVRKNIILAAAYVPAAKAWIRDVNRDGRGDRIFIAFRGKVSRLPEWVEAQWNTLDSPAVRVGRPSLSFMDPESTVVVADYSSMAFSNPSSPAPSGREPRVKFPADIYYGGQTTILEDSLSSVAGIRTVAESAADMIWLRGKTLGGSWFSAHPPRIIECYDARGGFLGEAYPSGTPNHWVLPGTMKVRIIRISAFDGTELHRILGP